MIKYLKQTTILAFLLTFTFAGELDLGASMPMGDVKMTDISGKTVTLNDVKMENGLLVNFSCNKCPWVIAWQDRYNSLSEVSNKNKIGFITINPNTKNRAKIGEGLDDMRDFSKKYGHNFLYTVDKGAELATAFGATKTPHIYLFDGKGKLVYRGAIDDNARKPKKVKNSWLMDAIAAVGTGNNVSIKETKALGCSIKFSGK
jgi:peroxiredoxin